VGCRVGGRRLRVDLVLAVSEEVRKRPALDHLFFWFMFSQGGVISALLLPVHVLIQGILGPLGVVPVADRHYDTWINLLGNPLVKLYILVLVMFSFFHFAHRIRYFLVDVGVHAAKSLPAQALFYGGAVVVTLITIWILLTTAPISLG
jgi:fumarate reductase subunit D